MSTSNSKKRISITVDAELLEAIDKITNNRSAAVESGLRLWHQQQIENQLSSYYQNQQASEHQFDENWGEFAQIQMEEILENQEQ